MIALLCISFRLRMMKHHDLLFQQPSILYTSRIRKCLSTAATHARIYSLCVPGSRNFENSDGIYVNVLSRIKQAR